MNQDWLWPRLRSWALLLAFFSQMTACQQSGPLQGTVVRPADQKNDSADKDKRVEDPETERVTPPSNIIGSYLVCLEQEQFSNIQQNATLHCGVYREPSEPVSVSYLKQWQLTGSPAALRALSPSSASVVELRFQAADLNALRLAVRRARLSVQDDAGDRHEGLVSDLLPAESRLATGNSNRTGSLVPLWNEGFEGSRISSDYSWFHDPRLFVGSVAVDWVNPASQTTACGLPVFEVMRFAIQDGSTDSIGAAEGSQFIDTDSACWPETAIDAIRGPSNLVIRKELTLVPGRVYRVSFKVRQQPLPPGLAPGAQGLQLKINQTVVRDIRTFAAGWQEISFDWVARSGTSRFEWIDVGAGDDSIGVLLDDLRVQGENF